ncbi:MAG: hypothetical protein WC188_02245 [Candidatus Caldatribacteriota bacterium]
MGKAKGNKMERDTAKILSYWMFDDEHTLKREPTSGAMKYNYCGDIFPMKQIEWKHFPFLIETKTGYENNTPTLWQYTKVIEWFNKSLNESLQHNQHIIFLICQFKNKPKLLFTNHHFDLDKIIPLSILPNERNGSLDWIYVYSFKNILKLNFIELFNNIIEWR